MSLNITAESTLKALNLQSQSGWVYVRLDNKQLLVDCAKGLCFSDTGVEMPFIFDIANVKSFTIRSYDEECFMQEYIDRAYESYSYDRIYALPGQVSMFEVDRHIYH